MRFYSSKLTPLPTSFISPLRMSSSDACISLAMRIISDIPEITTPNPRASSSAGVETLWGEVDPIHGTTGT